MVNISHYVRLAPQCFEAFTDIRPYISLHTASRYRWLCSRSRLISPDFRRAMESLLGSPLASWRYSLCCPRRCRQFTISPNFYGCSSSIFDVREGSDMMDRSDK